MTTAIAWTLRNTEGHVPPGLRGTAYAERHILLLDNLLIVSTLDGAETERRHGITPYPTTEEARAAAVHGTQGLEEIGWHLNLPPSTYEVGAGLVTKVHSVVGSGVGSNEFLDALFTLVLNGGRAA